MLLNVFVVRVLEPGDHSVDLQLAINNTGSSGLGQSGAMSYLLTRDGSIFTTTLVGCVCTGVMESD